MSRGNLSLFVCAIALLPAFAATPPSVVSLSPAVSTGGNQVLTVTYNAPGGYQTLDILNLLINTFLDGRQACYLAYSRSANALYIVADSGDASQISGKVMDGTGTVSNSQCAVALSNSSAAGSGNTLTLTLSLTFAASFAGNKVIYAAARDLSQNNSGWQTMGVHNVPGATPTYPNPAGMSPSSGSTQSQTLTFSYQDQTTATNLQTVWALINTALDGRAACYVAYYRPGNQLYLYPDSGDGNQATNIVLTGANTISNSQCSISAEGASIQTSGSTFTLTLPITFTNAFAGFRAVWMAAQTMNAAQTSAWQALGAWSVPAQSAQGTPVISSSPATATTSGGALSLQLPLLNIGTGTATAVQLTSATLGTLSPTSPALPLSVGTLAAASSAGLSLSFNASSLTVGTDYLLTLLGTYQSGGTAQPFTLYRIVTYGAPGIFTAPAKPVNVTPTLDSAHEATQTITAAAGGTITATGADGSVFTLVFPANAIVTDKPITMTPISSLAGVPSGSTFAAGVQFAPEGVILRQPATLTIQPATSIPAAQQAGFTYSTGGQDFHPYPLPPAAAVKLQVFHFSGYGVTVTVGKIEYVNDVSITSLGRFEEAVSAVLKQVAQDPGNTAALDRQIAGYCQEFFDNVLQPTAYAALSDPSQILQAEQDLLGLVTFTPREFTSVFQLLRDSAGAIIAQALTNAYNGYFNACINNGTFAGVSGRVALGAGMAQENALYGSLYIIWQGDDGRSFPNYVTQLSACLVGNIQANVDMEANGSNGRGYYLFDLKVSAQAVPLALDKLQLSLAANVVFNGTATVHYTQPMQVKLVGAPCASLYQWTEYTLVPGQLTATAVLDLDIVNTTSPPAYAFKFSAGAQIYEEEVQYGAEGPGGCIPVALADYRTTFFDDLSGEAKSGTPLYVILDHGTRNVSRASQGPATTGTYTITAALKSSQ